MWKRTFCGFVRLWLTWTINLTELDGFALFRGRLQLFLLIRGQAGALSKTSTCVCVCVPLLSLSLDLLVDVVDSGLKFLSSLFRRKMTAVCRTWALQNPHIIILYYIILYYTIQWLSCGLMHVHDFTDRQVWHWPVWVTAVQSEEAWRKQKTEFGFINIHVYKETYVFKCTCVTSFRQNKWISCRLLGHVVNFHLPIRKTEHIVRLKMKQDVSRIMTEF